MKHLTLLLLLISSYTIAGGSYEPPKPQAISTSESQSHSESTATAKAEAGSSSVSSAEGGSVILDNSNRLEFNPVLSPSVASELNNSIEIISLPTLPGSTSVVTICDQTIAMPNISGAIGKSEHAGWGASVGATFPLYNWSRHERRAINCEMQKSKWELEDRISEKEKLNTEINLMREQINSLKDQRESYK